jgi:O-Antigen ligase
MQTPFISHINLKNVLDPKTKLPISFVFIILGVLALLLFLGIYQEIGVFILPGLVALPAAFLAIRYPKIWLYFIAAMGGFFFTGSSEGLSAIDVVIGVAIFGSIIPWMFWMLAVKRVRLVKNTADFFFILFFLLLLFNAIVALLNGIDFMDWLRETLLISIILYYFPFRHYIKEKKDINIILFFFGLSTMIVCILQLNEYRKAMSSVVYAYQLLKSVKQNQPLLVAAVTVGMALFLHHKKLSTKILLLAFSGISFISLIVTMSRTFWIIMLFNLVIVYFLVNRKEKIQLLILAVVFSGITISSVFIVFGSNTATVLTLLENRLGSSTKGTQDLSVLSRVYEYDEMIKQIKKNPIGGYGMRAKINFYNPIDQLNTETAVNHNGYLFLFYRVGIPMALLYLFTMFYWTYKGAVYALRIKDSYYKNMIIALFACLVLIIISNFPSTQFHSRDAVFIMSLSYALISNIIDKYKMKQIN